jgi:DnaK suppressor protein
MIGSFHGGKPSHPVPTVIIIIVPNFRKANNIPKSIGKLFTSAEVCNIHNFLLAWLSSRWDGSTMKKKDIQYFKELLDERLEELLSQADNTVSGMTDQKENFPDPTDRATLEADRNFMLRIRDREHKLIKKIKKALDRIEDGTFGICDNCGEDISFARLKARPVTTQCIDCKTKQEAQEKALGI